MNEAGEEISAPEPLTPEHDVSEFECGIAELDKWLQQRALLNERSGASRTYVVCARGRVIGYYALATGAVVREEATGKVKRNMPEHVPVMLLARLAVDQEYQGHGIGQGLLRDAVVRVVQASKIVGIRAILVHAISDQARSFYEKFGFKESPVNPMTLMITVAEAEAIMR